MHTKLLFLDRHRVRLDAVVRIAAVLATGLLISQSVLVAQEIGPLATLGRTIPRDLAEFESSRVDRFLQARDAMTRWAAGQVWTEQDGSVKVLASVERLLEAREQVDTWLDETIAFRTRFATQEESGPLRERIRQFLRTTTALIDLSGRLRYLLRDAIDEASFELEVDAAEFQRLVELLAKYRSEIGASVVAYSLFDPPKASEVEPFPDAVKHMVLDLCRSAGQHGSVVDVIAFLRQEGQAPGLKIHAAEVLRELGLPQTARPNDEPLEASAAESPITPADLIKLLSSLPVSADNGGELTARRNQLLDWLHSRRRAGVAGDSLRLGRLQIREGDWFLMRNPSPYNSFTDLSPGLFTHVGIVTTEQGSDGIRRFVIVDLPERGSRIPATNAEAYLNRTLHYFFLRHRDPQVAQAMASAARQLIGNESQFDLTFQTSRVIGLAGQSLENVPVNTYCAGLLLLCALQTKESRESFFPIPEYPAGGHCQENLKTLGLSIGEDFVSPTGALFGGQFELVGRRQPMYDPGREIKERVYDHFAEQMVDQVLTPSPDVVQRLTQRLAIMSRDHPWLARALARANDVNERMDLESAAKAAAVIETLDEIADASRDQFYAARRALADERDLPEDAATQQLRQTHQALVARLEEGSLSPRELRILLVEFYGRQGERSLDKRFFPDATDE